MPINDVRPTIGFLTCHLDNDYAMEMCKGVEYAAEEADCNLIIFPGMYLNASYNDPVNEKYDYQNNSIFYYASRKSLDALIISVGSIGNFLSVEDAKSFVDSFDVPVLCLEIEVPGYPYLYTEGQTGMRAVLEHLIKVHHKTKIGFVNGRLKNADALERFNVYKKVLKENQIPYQENLVAYGDYSEYTEDIVGTLIDQNPGIEAIAFANDTMAIGGYKAIQKRGLVIGKDILVTGYDNTPTSLALDPPLTTVDNNIMDLGYQAVRQALELIKTGETSVSLLHSQMIRRRSCGCNPVSDSEKIQKISGGYLQHDAQWLTNVFEDLYMEAYKDSFYSGQLFAVLDPFLNLFTRIPFGKEAPSPSLIRMEAEKANGNSIISSYFTTEKLTYLFDLLADFLLHLDMPEESKTLLAEAVNIAITSFAGHLSNHYAKRLKTAKEVSWSSSYMIRDTLLTASDSKRCFSLIMNKLCHTDGFRSAYIYLYDEVPVQMASGLWQVPKYVLLQSCCKDGEIQVMEGDSRILPSYMIFNNKNTPNERRHTMILTPIFTNEMQHGLFLCETDLPNFNHVYSTSLQLGTCLKFITLMKQEMSIQNRLEATMDEIREKNDLLNSLSVTDELTGLYNRRGFFDISQQTLSNKANAGKHSLVAYLDMDKIGRAHV